jgi:phosphoribosyl-ATP pyrophosphohydrolase
MSEADGEGDPDPDADADPDPDRTETTDEILDELFAVIESRKAELPEDSYTTSLFTHEKGEDAVLEKLGEETTELLLAAKDGDDEELAHEAADIVYHLLVLFSMHDMDAGDLRTELAERRG